MTTLLIHVLNDTIGALQIGNSFSIFLFGILTLQLYNYYKSFPDDRWSYKVLVASVWVLELTYTIVLSFVVYRSTITLYGQPQLLVKLPGLGIITSIGGGITLLVQGFFAFRLFTVLPGKYRYIGPLSIFISWLRCFGGVYLTIEAIISPTVAQFLAQWRWLISTVLAVGAALDVLITVCTLYHFHQQQRIGHQRLANVIDRLSLYTLRTGLLTSVTAVFIVIMFQSFPHSFFWGAIYTVLAKLYSNSLMSVLNARQAMREEVRNSSQDRPWHSIHSGPILPTHSMVGSRPTIIELKTTSEKRAESPIRPLPPKISLHLRDL